MRVSIDCGEVLAKTRSDWDGCCRRRLDLRRLFGVVNSWSRHERRVRAELEGRTEGPVGEGTIEAAEAGEIDWMKLTVDASPRTF